MTKQADAPTGFQRHTRTHADSHSEPINADTFAALVTMLEHRYPGKVRRVVEVTPKAVVKIIDNEDDALETIRRMREAQS